MRSEDLSFLRGRIPDEYLERLLEKGISVRDLLTLSERQLAEELAIDRRAAREILDTVASMLLEPITADELLKEERSLLRTGIKGLDDLLGGGFQVGTINAIFGPPASGKTQFCLHMTARSLLTDREGGISSEEAIFLDTEGTFAPDRMRTFLSSNGLADRDLSRVRVFSAPGASQLRVALKLSLDFVREGSCKFVCVDSISYPFRGYRGLDGLRERQEELQEVLILLRRISEMGAVVLITAHAVKWGKEITSKGGFVLGHVPHNTLYFRKARRNLVIVSLEDSSYLPPGQAAFKITESGIESP